MWRIEAKLAPSSQKYSLLRVKDISRAFLGVNEIIWAGAVFLEIDLNNSKVGASWLDVKLEVATPKNRLPGKRHQPRHFSYHPKKPKNA